MTAGRSPRRKAQTPVHASDQDVCATSQGKSQPRSQDALDSRTMSVDELRALGHDRRPCLGVPAHASDPAHQTIRLSEEKIEV